MDDVYEVRKATYEFLMAHLADYQEPMLELSPMEISTMPYPEWHISLATHITKYFTVNSEAEFFDLEPTPTFSSVVAVNVLEHSQWVWRFSHHCRYLLKKEGRVYIFVPYNIRFHGPAPDLWRFTDTGLNYLMRDFKLVSMQYYGEETKPYGLGAIYSK